MSIELIPLWKGEFRFWIRLCSAEKRGWKEAANCTGYYEPKSTK